jgi:hypothetical protein
MGKMCKIFVKSIICSMLIWELELIYLYFFRIQIKY